MNRVFENSAEGRRLGLQALASADARIEALQAEVERLTRERDDFDKAFNDAMLEVAALRESTELLQSRIDADTAAIRDISGDYERARASLRAAEASNLRMARALAGLHDEALRQHPAHADTGGRCAMCARLAESTDALAASPPKGDAENDAASGKMPGSADSPGTRNAASPSQAATASPSEALAAALAREQRFKDALNVADLLLTAHFNSEVRKAVDLDMAQEVLGRARDALAESAPTVEPGDLSDTATSGKEASAVSGGPGSESAPTPAPRGSEGYAQDIKDSEYDKLMEGYDPKTRTIVPPREEPPDA